MIKEAARENVEMLTEHIVSTKPGRLKVIYAHPKAGKTTARFHATMPHKEFDGIIIDEPSIPDFDDRNWNRFTDAIQQLVHVGFPVVVLATPQNEDLERYKLLSNMAEDYIRFSHAQSYTAHNLIANAEEELAPHVWDVEYSLNLEGSNT